MTDGDVTSDVEYLYNNFSQVITERQQHGAATSGTSPKVEYGYTDGSANTVRRTSCTYPDARVVNYDYGSGADDNLSRVQKIKIGTTDIVEYDYLGLNQVVVQKYVEPATDVEYTLATGSGSNLYAWVYVWTICGAARRTCWRLPRDTRQRRRVGSNRA